MSEIDLEGTDILEQLAERDMLDPFFEAVQADDLEKINWLMSAVGLSREDIELVFDRMAKAKSKH